MFTEERRLLLARLVAENGGKPIRVCVLGKEGVPVRWFETTDSPFYDYRVTLPNEVVFDIDDKDWETVRGKAILIDATLKERGVKRWVALSGKKGIHIHVFLGRLFPGAEVSRTSFAHDVMRKINEEFGESVEVDAVGYAKEVQQFREFGTKGVWRKTLWTFPVHELPLTREEAYQMADFIHPTTLPERFVFEDDARRAMRDFTGHSCAYDCPADISLCENASCPVWH